jgi:acetyltransferase-like isoleucine patch superfamily enzyme
VRRFLTVLVCLVVPSAWKPPLLRLLGHRVHRRARIKLSIVKVDRLYLGADTRIGHLNIIQARRLVIRERGYVGHLNWISGGLSIALKQNGAIGHRNHINSGVTPGCNRRPQLRIGIWAKITAGHFVNACETIVLGNYSTIAGYGSQLWTHGFVHEWEGIGRSEVRGRIIIKDNVYIGSNCTLQAGITIEKAVSVGAHASVAKSLLEPGVYVPQELRYLAKMPHQRLASLNQVHFVSATTPLFWRDGGGVLRDSALQAPNAHAPSDAAQ